MAPKILINPNAEDQKEKEGKCKNCEFDMYGDCDGSGDDVELNPDTDEA